MAGFKVIPEARRRLKAGGSQDWLPHKSEYYVRILASKYKPASRNTASGLHAATSGGN